MRKRPNLKLQDIAKQVAVRSQDRVRIVKMEATRPEVPASEGAPSQEKKP
jgi:NADH-quinone oxidoreductase subunit J